MFELSAGDRAAIARIVGDLFIATPNREVLREFYKRHRKAARRVRPTPGEQLLRLREVRRAVYREALACHSRNWQLYRSVVSGNVG